MKASDTDIAWCAGFFDGEGHVSYTRSYPSDVTNRVTGGLRCNVSQAADNVEVLEFFKSVIPLGRLTKEYPPSDNIKKKNTRYISFATDEVETLFLILQPYLKSRKSQDFRNALARYLSHDPKATADDYVRWLKWKKKKGLI
jgi:hypothetical protein